MKWRLYRLRRWLRNWLEAAPLDDFANVSRHVRDLTWDARHWQREMDALLEEVQDRVKALDGQCRMLALRAAKEDIEKAGARRDA
jgi:hypothetical protein